jgi:hypothetical protein
MKSVLGFLTAAVLAASCSTVPTSTSTVSTSSTTETGTAGASSTTETGTAGASGTVWLCRPGLAADPCTANLTAMVVHADGKKIIQRAIPAENPPIDCFYVYLTVSGQTTENANLHIEPEEIAVAISQASRFSQVCKVYAPMYPQLTLSAIGVRGKKIGPHAAAIAYLGLLASWKDYLAHDNHGRGVVLIGHSQGAALPIPLIRHEIDPNLSERHLLVSALLMGGNVTVPTGKSVGGDFKNIPACQSIDQTSCEVAYSSFDTTPPINSLFGRAGTSLSAQSGVETTPAGNLQVLCTNPGDHRPVVHQVLGPRWVLHLVDINIAPGN